MRLTDSSGIGAGEQKVEPASLHRDIAIDGVRLGPVEGGIPDGEEPQLLVGRSAAAADT